MDKLCVFSQTWQKSMFPDKFNLHDSKHETQRAFKKFLDFFNMDKTPDNL